MRTIRTTALAAVAAVLALVAACGAGPRDAAAEASYRVLFDNAHGQTAGNADWVISTSQPDPTQEDADPAGEDSWTGAISAWGVALHAAGEYAVSTNPQDTPLTYGGGGDLDLQNVNALVLAEPNNSLSAEERKAVLTFVQNGGGLFMIADHDNSDRDNDGIDSVGVLNELMSANGVDDSDPFGITVDKANISDEDPKNVGDAEHPVMKGAAGAATGSIIRGGTTATLSTAANEAATGLLYRDSADNAGATDVFVASSTFGEGRVVFWGDSSPVDDGTGDPGDTLYDGWNDPAGTNAELALNATDWLVKKA